ncbi:MAG: substrate-binding domain-containing protein, partial [Sphaerochaetaceae bacterium]|nr:substrate-binding domain-containing protein [Sphaerochaetaceae bacterium]
EGLMYKKGYSIVLCCSNDSLEQENQKLRLLLEKNVDALVVIPISGITEHFLAARKAGIPLVAVDRPLGGVAADTVMVNNFIGAKQVTAHLIHEGFRRIGFIGGSIHVQTATERYMGYLDAFKDANLPVDQNFVLFGGMTQDAGRALMREALSSPNHPDAFFCVNDMVHIGATSYLFGEASVSEESRIVFGSFDLMYYGSLLKNCHYAAVQPVEAMGEAIVDILLRRLGGDNSDFPNRIVLDPEIRVLAKNGGKEF